jgi:predicted nucleotidyltransferase component of viral defense system
MISLREVQRLAFEERMPEQAIERDYVLTWVLSEIARHPTLGTQAMLKGGTAIKKLYLPDWRYSEDLDFTLRTPWETEPLVTALDEVNTACTRSAGFEVAVASQEPRRQADRLRSLTVYLAYLGPLRRTRRWRELKVDFTADELIVESPVRCPLPHIYSDEIEPAIEVLAYPLEEILAEKMRTLLQRTEPRDLYDVWRLLTGYEVEIDLFRTKDIFQAKCRFKGLAAETWPESLSGERVERFAAAWNRRLGEQVEDLPPLNTVVRQMRRLMRTQWR